MNARAWRECKLGDVIILKRGYDLPARDREDGPFPIISSGGISGWHVRAKVRGPGVVTGRYGTLGEVYFVPGDFWPLNTSLYVQDFRGNDPRFISYFLKTLGLSGRNAAGAVPGVNRNHLHILPVSVPTPSTQRRIADILGAYDDLIENNTRRIAILEEMARRLYEEWFVCFRFPGHEQVRLVDSPLGPIPEAWKIDTLANLSAKLQDGDWIESKDQGGEDYRLLQVSNIGIGEFVETGNYRYVTSETFQRLQCTEVVEGDILISRMPKPIGRAWLVTKMPYRMITAVDVAILRANADRIAKLVLLHMLNWHDNLARVEQQSTGTTRARIARRHLASLPFVVPPLDLQHRFSAAIGDGHRLASLRRRHSDNLRTQRELLLPKLVSGEIDVSDAAAAEEVAAA